MPYISKKRLGEVDKVITELQTRITVLERVAAAVTAANSSTRDPEKPNVLDELLQAAAGISAAHLYTHRDNWAFLVEHAGRNPHFRVPGKVTPQKHGAVRVALSGRSLVATLTSLDALSQQPDTIPDDTRALALRLYEQLKTTVQAIADAPQTGGDKPVTIVIDDRQKEEE